MIGMPVVHFLKAYPRNKIDSFAGNISYGVYLNHFTIKTVLQQVIGHEPHGLTEWTTLILLSIAAAVMGYFMVEFPIRKLRNKRKLITP